MKTQIRLQISELPAFIAFVLADKQHDNYLLVKNFMDDANQAYLMLVEHGSIELINREGNRWLFTYLCARLSGMKSVIACLPDMNPVYNAFALVLDILNGDFEEYYSAWFANLPPDFAVLENAVIETAQGATYPLCDFCIEQGHENVLIDAQASPPLYSHCAQCAHYPAHLKHGWLYHLGDCTPEEYAEECLRLERLQSVPVQPTDSFFNPLSLSIYDECLHEYDRRDICLLCGHDIEDDIEDLEIERVGG